MLFYVSFCFMYVLREKEVLLTYQIKVDNLSRGHFQGNSLNKASFIVHAAFYDKYCCCFKSLSLTDVVLLYVLFGYILMVSKQ